MDLRRVKRRSGGSDSGQSSHQYNMNQPPQYSSNPGPYAPPQPPYNMMPDGYGAPPQQPHLGYGPPQPQPGYGSPPPPYNMAAPGFNPNYNTPYPPAFNAPQPQVFDPQQFLQDPMATMAMQYGQVLAGQGKDMVNQKLERYVSVSRLKYYFAVDTTYVAKKIGLIFFPFHHTDWAIKYDQNEPIVPRYEVNAPDLYIPSMAFVTFILFSGYLLGLQNKFSPEHLGLQASSTLGWLFAEVLFLMLTMYILNIKCESLRFFDLMAYCGYKCVTMIALLVASVALGTVGYMVTLLYGSAALGFFLLRSLRIALLSNPGTDQHGNCSRRSLYLLLGVCLFQPMLMYWMTHSLAGAARES